MFPMNLYGLYGQSLADVWLTWVTSGLFIGQRRIILDTQGMLALTCPHDYSSKYESNQSVAVFRDLSDFCTSPNGGW